MKFPAEWESLGICFGTRQKDGEKAEFGVNSLSSQQGKRGGNGEKWQRNVGKGKTWIKPAKIWIKLWSDKRQINKGL